MRGLCRAIALNGGVLVRDGRISRREFYRKAALIAGGGVAAEFLGETVAPRVVRAASSITLDTTQDPLAQGYSTEGTAPYRPGVRLGIDDVSNIDRRVSYKVAPEIEAGPVTVDASIQIAAGGLVTDGEDTDLHIVLNGGANVGTEIRLACILRNGERRMAYLTPQVAAQLISKVVT